MNILRIKPRMTSWPTHRNSRSPQHLDAPAETAYRPRALERILRLAAIPPVSGDALMPGVWVWRVISTLAGVGVLRVCHRHNLYAEQRAGHRLLAFESVS